VHSIANEPNQEQWLCGVEIPFDIPNRQFIRSNIMIPVRIGVLPESVSMNYTLNVHTSTTILSGSLEDVNQTPGVITGLMTMPKESVSLWWPVGMGSQPLYYISISTLTGNNDIIASSTRRFGFRTIVLNEMPVTSDEIAFGVAPGNKWCFEINGHPSYAKGRNFIPPDVFWLRVPQSVRTLFDSVVAGKQNMFQPWSCGAYSPNFLYDVADELGILLWSEFESGDALYPVDAAFPSTAYEETVYQVRRVNRHPSL
jgi:beta-mannosidase